MVAPVFKKISRNLRGRCFVVGDIHGAFNSVMSQMDSVNFDFKKDRLFCVGDLIDRGKDSVAVLEFLSLPFVHSIRGNHDTNFMQLSIEDIRALSKVRRYGMEWANDIKDDVILKIQSAISKLPIAMEIETHRGSVGLVHADVPKGMHWNKFISLLEAGDQKTIETALWSRDRIESSDTSGVIGIDRLFVGHSIQWEGPKKLGNVYHIDSGAVFKELNDSDNRGMLNIINLSTSTESLTQNSKLGIYQDSAKCFFGNYSMPEAQG